MSKVAENKALEEYPIDIIPDDDTMGFTSSDRNEVIRLGYIKGYDQAFKDFLKKAEEFFDEELYMSVSDQICSINEFKTMKDFVNYFKNYMQ